MKTSITRILALAICLAMILSLCAFAAEDASADMVLKNGEIQTMVSEDDLAQAIAIRGGEIVYVGDDNGVETFIDPDTQVIDLEGQYVLPGFIDGHIHGASVYLTADTELSLMELGPDLEAYKAAVSEFVQAHPDYPIYIIDAMDLKAFPDSTADNAWLDEICDDKPICCSDVSFHGSLLNTFAIEMLGITKDTPAPPSGNIYKDENGELTGYFSDCGALLEGLPAFEYTEDQIVDAFLALQAEANSYGLTAFDSGAEEYMTPALLAHLHEDGGLNLRFNFNFFVNDGNTQGAEEAIAFIEENQQYESDFLNVRQVKFKMDGVPEGKSSYLLEPYDPAAGEAPDYRSSAATDQEGFTDFVIAMNTAGYTVQTHCMGDASVQLAMNSFEAAQEALGDTQKECRNKIAHVNLITDEDVQRMADLEVIAAMQPMWFYYDPFFSPLEEQMFGEERFNQEYHIRDMLDAGVIITGSNDYPVTLDFAPLHAIEAGATQCSPYPGEDDQPEIYTRNADQAVTVYEMIQMYTTNAAYGAFFDDLVGTIEVGKKADLVVLGNNLLTCDVKEISDTPVIYTISDGRIVYEG